MNRNCLVTGKLITMLLSEQTIQEVIKMPARNRLLKAITVSAVLFSTALINGLHAEGEKQNQAAKPATGMMDPAMHMMNPMMGMMNPMMGMMNPMMGMNPMMMGMNPMMMGMMNPMMNPMMMGMNPMMMNPMMMGMNPMMMNPMMMNPMMGGYNTNPMGQSNSSQQSSNWFTEMMKGFTSE